jgi:two-component system, OmpR family, sensor kinase
MRWLLGALGLIAGAFGLWRWTRAVRQQAYESAQNEFSHEKLRFLQRLDHELKNPLTAMQVALANLEDTDDTEARRAIGSSLHAQLMRVGRLISDLRKLAALEKGAMEQGPVDVADLLHEVTDVFRDDKLSHERRFTTTYDANALPALVGDRDLLMLAIFNLLDNARKFTASGDTITLHADVEGDWLALRVQDTGRGIPEDDLPHVWEDLYRSSDVQGVPGSGVGLAMVRGIVVQHGGEVEIASAYGSGTTVKLWLPLPGN